MNALTATSVFHNMGHISKTRLNKASGGQKKKIDRRDFLQVSALVTLSLAFAEFGDMHYKPRLSFSTLGCSDWSFEQIVIFADKHGYDGIEIRGIQRELDLPQSPEFNKPKNRKERYSF